MKLDIRKPIGLLLLVVGIELAVFGALGDPAIYQRSLGLNVNLIWGGVLVVCGGLFLLAGARGSRNPR
jgi:hypothetical protein